MTIKAKFTTFCVIIEDAPFNNKDLGQNLFDVMVVFNPLKPNQSMLVIPRLWQFRLDLG